MFKKGDVVRLKETNNPKYLCGVILRVDRKNKTADIRWGYDQADLLDEMIFQFGSHLNTENWMMQSLISLHDPDSLLKDIL